jgi:RNA 2',3'-cyclic 3'-phosphodiesterase
LRLFFALWPPPTTAAALYEWSSALQGRAIPAENIHLTLAFLGEADPAKATAAARPVRARRHRLPIDVARYVKRNEMVWAAPRDMPLELAELVRALHLQLYRHEFILDRRPFAAHVTLLRKAAAPKTLPPPPRVDWPVDEFLLVRSRTSSKGASYEPVERFPLSE